MEGWLIAVLVVVVVIVLIICLIQHMKKKIKNKLIDKGAEVITKTAGNVLNEDAANAVTDAANLTAEGLKNGKVGLIKAAIKKGQEKKKVEN